MTKTHSLRILCGLILTCIGLFAGCQALEDRGFRTYSLFPEPVDYQKINDHRVKFQEKGDPASMKWLLGQLDTGAPLDEVNHMLGQEGERVYDDLRYKTRGGHYQSTDEAYKWGPANNGQVVVLFFREGLLVNFDPNEFREE